MRTTVVPAQVTTVEDKIAGNLGFTQLLLLVTPVFLGAAIFVMFPPLFRLTVLKMTIVGILAIVCAVLAIRVKGVIILNWLLILTRYNIRPKYHIYNKNDLSLRESPPARTELTAEQVTPTETEAPAVLALDTNQLIQAHLAIGDPRSKFQFRTDKKGVLRAYIHEIPEEAV